MHKAFIHDKPLIFESVYNEIHENKLQILSDSEYTIDDIIRLMNENSKSGILYLSASPDQVWIDFVKRYVLVEAAGGLVKNSNNEYLMIFRKKHWDLPKGKLDYGETPEECALREVKEECGINNLAVQDFLMNTFHTYPEKNKFILKKTHWFSMRSDGKEELIPQLEEDIEKAKWMSKEKILNRVVANTYNSILDVIHAFVLNR